MNPAFVNAAKSGRRQEPVDESPPRVVAEDCAADLPRYGSTRRLGRFCIRSMFPALT